MKPTSLPAFADALVLHFLTAQAAGQLRPEYRETLAAGVEKMLREQIAAADAPEAYVCAICLEHVAEPAVLLPDESILCAPCGCQYQRALVEGGAVVRFVCKANAVGDEACGRVVRIGYTTLRTGPIVTDGNATCGDCLEKRRKRRWARLGVSEGGSDATR